MDGKIIIGIDVNDKDLDKKLNNLGKEIDSKIEDKTIDINLNVNNINDIQKEMDKLNKEFERIEKKGEVSHPFVMGQVSVLNSNLTPEEEAYYQRLKDIYAELEAKKVKLQTGGVDMEYVNKMKQYYKELAEGPKIQLTDAEKESIRLGEMRKELNEMVETYEKMQNLTVIDESEKQRVIELKQEIIDLKNQIEEITGNKIDIKGFEDMEKKARNTKNELSKIPNSIGKIVKSVGKWALALFGIRTAYNFIRSSMSTISQYDGQLKTDIEYIRYSLAMTIKPVVQKIIDMAYTLLNVINTLSKELFNYDLFSQATKENFRQTSGYANDIKKSLAGFDEMNILGDQSSGGGGGEIQYEPSGNWDKEEEKAKNFVEKVKEWIKTLTDFYQKNGIDQLFNVEGNWHLFFVGLGTALDGLWRMVQGLFDFIVGLGEMLIGVLIGDEEMISEGWEKFTKGLGEIIGGLVEFIMGLILMIIGAVFGLIKDIWDALWDLQNKILKIVGDVIYDILKAVGEFFIKIAQWAKEKIDKIISFVAGIPGAIAGFINGILTSVGTFLSKLVTKVGTKFGEIKEKMMEPINNFIEGVKNLWGNIKSSVEEVARNIGDKLNPNTLFNNVKTGLGNIGSGIKNFFGFRKGGIIYPPKLAVGGVINQPGRGVPLTSAIGGEHGAEGVIPLTDSQQMALLGEAIGKYITINASITNTMNGRVISRELQKVQNNSDFAFNK